MKDILTQDQKELLQRAVRVGWKAGFKPRSKDQDGKIVFHHVEHERIWQVKLEQGDNNELSYLEQNGLNDIFDVVLKNSVFQLESIKNIDDIAPIERDKLMTLQESLQGILPNDWECQFIEYEIHNNQHYTPSSLRLYPPNTRHYYFITCTEKDLYQLNFETFTLGGEKLLTKETKAANIIKIALQHYKGNPDSF